jgi:c-di-GMP-binding flagellar brake protein YcgR
MYNKNLGYDRRRFQRLALNIAVTYSIKEPLVARIVIGDMDIQAHMLDLTQAGLAIVTNHNVPIETIISLSFDLAKVNEKGIASLYETIKAAGEVRSNIKLRADEYRLGICFIAINEQDKTRIAEFVNMALGR